MSATDEGSLQSLVSDKQYFILTVFNFSTDRIRNVEFLELAYDVKLQMYSVAIGT